MVSVPLNLLPADGETHYFGSIFLRSEADRYLSLLRETVDWRHDEMVMFGKRIVTARKVAWYGDPGCDYTYSGATKVALPWIPVLRELKTLVETRSGASFNSCLLNLYHHGGEGMAWHSDDEPEIVQESAIASLSFGAERPFRFKRKRGEGPPISVHLEHGSLLVMAGATQTHWLHCLPKTTRVKDLRVNLTFRLIQGSGAQRPQRTILPTVGAEPFQTSSRITGLGESIPGRAEISEARGEDSGTEISTGA
jgi:alkylated DNA repair dioxygenase AlkB